MTQIPDSLRSVFTGSIEQNGSDYVVTIPASEIQHDGLSPDETYRIAVFEREKNKSAAHRSQTAERRFGRESPPVSVDEILEVEIESIGDEGDGIAKVDRGYVVIVPDGQPGDRLTVRIDEVKENVAFAEIHH